MDRVKLRALAVAANSAGCTFAESDGSLDSEECCAWEIADEAMHDSLTPEVLLDLLDALEAADVKNTLLSACLHKAEDERDALRADLDRYRWLCEHAVITDNSADGMVAITAAASADTCALVEAVPIAIDAARKG